MVRKALQQCAVGLRSVNYVEERKASHGRFGL